ncbi:hypothetical protein Ancab_035561, partial [Ancistrocladus abbreviatus]
SSINDSISRAQSSSSTPIHSWGRWYSDPLSVWNNEERQNHATSLGQRAAHKEPTTTHGGSIM